MLESFRNFIKNLFDLVVEFFSERCHVEEYHLPAPPFDEMKKWTKTQIDEHAETYGIMLDRRRRKEVMIEDYRKAYQELLDKLGINK